MLDNLCIHDRLGGLDVGLRRFGLGLSRQHISSGCIDQSLTLVAVALHFCKGLRALFTHARLSLLHSSLQPCHLSGQTSQSSLEFVID